MSISVLVCFNRRLWKCRCLYEYAMSALLFLFLWNGLWSHGHDAGHVCFTCVKRQSGITLYFVRKIKIITKCMSWMLKVSIEILPTKDSSWRSKKMARFGSEPRTRDDTSIKIEILQLLYNIYIIDWRKSPIPEWEHPSWPFSTEHYRQRLRAIVCYHGDMAGKVHSPTPSVLSPVLFQETRPNRRDL